MYLADDGNFRMLKEAGVKAAKEPIHNLGLYNHLILSEIDKNKWNEFNEQSKIKRRICETLVTMLKTLKDKERHYETFVDPVLM